MSLCRLVIALCIALSLCAVRGTLQGVQSALITHYKRTRRAISACPVVLSELCKNDAVCALLEQPREFTCICPDIYYGKYCQFRNTKCNTSPCQNGGSCLPTDNNRYSCTCMEGFAGPRCQKNVFCSTNPCQNGGKCLDTSHSYKCQCSPAYKGPTCADIADACFSNPCKHEMKCSRRRDGYKCICKFGWEGDNCELGSYDPCAEAVCEHGGSCVERPEGTQPAFACRCSPGYRGATCSRRITSCRGKPCLNGGVCHVKRGGFRCSCPDKFAGEYCESEKEDVDPEAMVESDTARTLFAIWPMAVFGAGVLLTFFAGMFCITVCYERIRLEEECRGGEYGDEEREQKMGIFSMTKRVMKERFGERCCSCCCCCNCRLECGNPPAESEPLLDDSEAGESVYSSRHGDDKSQNQEEPEPEREEEVASPPPKKKCC